MSYFQVGGHDVISWKKPKTPLTQIRSGWHLTALVLHWIWFILSNWGGIACPTTCVHGVSMSYWESECRLKFQFFPVYSADQDHSRALQACIRGPAKDWRRRTGRPRQTWLRTVDDLHPLNFGLASARRHAWDRPAWRTLVEAATSSWHAPERETTKRDLRTSSLYR